MGYTTDDFERFQKAQLNPEDTFHFECSMCGNCCRNRREPILVTGTDVFRIAKSLNEPIANVLIKNMRTYVGEDSHVPVVVLDERLDGSCRFLRKGKCMIQNDKPVACAIFPLGRYFDARDKSFHYFMNEPCSHGKTDIEHTLQEWLDEFHIVETERMTSVWHTLLGGIAQLTHKMKKESIQGEFMKELLYILYVGYDIDKPYEEQVKRNMEVAEIVFQKRFGKHITF